MSGRVDLKGYRPGVLSAIHPIGISQRLSNLVPGRINELQVAGGKRCPPFIIASGCLANIKKDRPDD